MVTNLKSLNTEELAKILVTSRATIHLWRKRGLPSSRVSMRQWSYDLTQVLNWLAKNGQADYAEHVAKKYNITL